MPINVGYNGTQVSWANDDFYNGFPNSTPAAQATGIATQEISLLEAQKYTIDIYNDMKKFAPKEFPLMTILEGVSGGTIDRFFEMWTDEYEGVDVIDTAIDQLRLRDTVGNTGVTPTKPFALSSLGEIGGELIFQYASVISGTHAVADFGEMADGCKIYLNGIGGATRPTTKGEYQAAYLDKLKIKEISPVGNTTDSKKLVTLGFYRSGTASETYSNIIGRTSEIIRKYQNTLEVNEYTATKFTDVVLTPVHDTDLPGEDWYEYKYEENKGRIVHAIFDNLELAELAGLTAAQMSKIQVLVGISRFLFNASLSAFVLELDFNESNLDYFKSTSGTQVGGATLEAGTDYGYWQLTKVLTEYASAYPVGSIYRFEAGKHLYDAQGNDLISTLDNDTNFLFEKVTNAIMLEETNTSVDNKRIFGAGIGSTYANPKGCTRMARHITINRFDDVPEPNSELDGFSTELQGNYVRTNEISQNFLQIYNAKPWAISTMRQGTGIRFGDTVQQTRERFLKAYRRQWTNIMLYGKKGNFSTDEKNYKGTTSGFFDFEMFPIKYGTFPVPVNFGSHTQAENVKGQKMRDWFSDLARAANASSVPGTYEGKTFLVGIEMIDWLRANTAIIGTSSANVFGMTYESIAPSKVTLGLEVMEYKTTYGTLRFIHEPALDLITKFKVPRHLFAEGKLSPRWTGLMIDKNYAEIISHKTRTDKIYGNLQANNQPFVQMEGISAAKLFKLRFPRNHGVFNFEPNY